MKASTEELQKHTLNLRKGDYERIQATFPDLSAAVVIRKIISNFLDRDVAKVPGVELLEIDT